MKATATVWMLVHPTKGVICGSCSTHKRYVWKNALSSAFPDAMFVATRRHHQRKMQREGWRVAQVEVYLANP